MDLFSGFLSFRHRNWNPDLHRASHTLSLPALVQLTAKSHHLAGFYGLMKCLVLRQARVWHLGTVESWSQFWHRLPVALGKSCPLRQREFIECPMAPLNQRWAVKQSSALHEQEASRQRWARPVSRTRDACAPHTAHTAPAVTKQGLQDREASSGLMHPCVRATLALKCLEAKYRHVFGPSSLVLQLHDTIDSCHQALQVWAEQGWQAHFQMHSTVH